MATLASDSKENLPQPVSAPTPSQASTSDTRLWVMPANVLSKSHLFTDVDPQRSTFPLAAYCFMTGYM